VIVSEEDLEHVVEHVYNRIINLALTVVLLKLLVYAGILCLHYLGAGR
jgi:hypothetical protein